jgi:hypothetical protein
VRIPAPIKREIKIKLNISVLNQGLFRNNMAEYRNGWKNAVRNAKNIGINI